MATSLSLNSIFCRAFLTLFCLPPIGWGHSNTFGPDIPASPYRIVVIAHRGDHTYAPENTLEAYQAAIDCGADYVEVDLRTTADGHLVILHDASVKKMTGHEGYVKDLTYEQIHALVIPPKFPKDKRVYRIPDFESVLKLCNGHINIYLDFKDADVADTYRWIKEEGMQRHVVVYLNKKEQYDAWRNVAPDIPLMASLPVDSGVEELKKRSPEQRIDLVDNAYDSMEIAQLHQLNIQVWLDVESAKEGPEQWKQLLDRGADGLQTDKPEALIHYLKQENRR